MADEAARPFYRTASSTHLQHSPDVRLYAKLYSAFEWMNVLGENKFGSRFNSEKRIQVAGW
jgi:hypothetical protein